MSLYLLLDLAVLFFPVVLSFDRKVAYVRRWPRALLSAAAVAVPFLVWDVLMTRAGAWSFSHRWAGEARLAGLPPAEILFFLVVPFACLFIYDVVGAYFRERVGRPHRLPWLALSAVLGAASVALRQRLYTSTILAATALVLAVTAAWAPALLASRRYWLAMLLTYAPFLVMNGVLTALPVVSYADTAILGARVYTIPVEDFLYSFAMLGLALLVYHRLCHRARAQKGEEERLDAQGGRG